MRHDKRDNHFFVYLLSCGMLSILIFVVFLIMIMVRRNIDARNTDVLVNEMNTENSVEGFTSLNEFEKYLNSIFETNDVDRYLRACAIEERTKNYPCSFYMTQNNVDFSYDTAFLPSKVDEDYYYVNQSLITKDYIEQYNELISQLKDLSNKKKPMISLLSMDILFPGVQLSKDGLDNIRKKSKRWGAEIMLEFICRVKVEKTEAVFGITIGRYEGYYKIFRMQALSLKWDSEIFVKKKSFEDYKEMIRFEENNEFTYLKPDEFVNNVESLILDDIAGEKRVSNFVKNPEEATLPLNYYVTDKIYFDTSEKAISSFILELRRKNVKKALNYCSFYKEGDSLEEVLMNEGELNLQLSYLYKGLAGLPYAVDPIPYEQLPFYSSDVYDYLIAKNIHTLLPQEIYNLEDISKIKKMKDREMYIVKVYYNRIFYYIGFTTVHEENGWIIQSLGASKAGIKQGEVVQAYVMEAKYSFD